MVGGLAVWMGIGRRWKCEKSENLPRTCCDFEVTLPQASAGAISAEALTLPVVCTRVRVKAVEVYWLVYGNVSGEGEGWEGTSR